MEFSWHELKREWVLAERGIDFLDLAKGLFDDRPLLTLFSTRGDEERFVSVGLVEGKFFALVWSRRGAEIRLITARRARDAEEKQYRALHDG